MYLHPQSVVIYTTDFSAYGVARIDSWQAAYLLSPPLYAVTFISPPSDHFALPPIVIVARRARLPALHYLGWGFVQIGSKGTYA